MLRPTCAFVPPYVFEALLGAEDPVLVAHARATLAVDTVIRGQRRSAGTRGAMPWATGAADTPTDSGTGPQRTIYDAHGATTLPGTRVRGEGDPPTADEAVTQAYDGLGDTWELYDTAYGRDSLDGRGLPLHASVHYGARYDNAFWDGTQMVFGDGDGTIFLSFTRSIDVIGHELTHGVTQYTANLTYQNQSGALNESVSDVFGVLVKQRTLGQSADQADWLVGADLLAPSVHGVALRSMKAPGTAYDDPRLGKDPQPATMSGYVTTSSDNGGVHTNSGIPNHAFYLAATGIGGNAWETAGQIWYDVLTGPDITTGCDFATFAELTYAAAQSRFGASSAEASAVASAWEGVELPVTGAGSGGNGSTGGSAGGSASGVGHVPPASARVRVRRTGGFAGLVMERTVVLEELPRHDVRSWQELIGGDRLEAMAAGSTHPDAFCYDIACSDPDVELSIPEPAMPEEVRLLFERTLEG